MSGLGCTRSQGMYDSSWYRMLRCPPRPHEYGVQAGRELSSLLHELVGFELCTPHGWCIQSLGSRMQDTAGKLEPHTSRAEEELGALEGPRSGAVDVEAAGRKLLCPGTAIHLVSPSLQSSQLCCAEHLHAEWHLHCTARLCAPQGMRTRLGFGCCAAALGVLAQHTGSTSSVLSVLARRERERSLCLLRWCALPVQLDSVAM